MRAVTGRSAVAEPRVVNRCGAASTLWADFKHLMCSARSPVDGGASPACSGVTSACCTDASAWRKRDSLSWSRKPVSSARYASWANAFPRRDW